MCRLQIKIFKLQIKMCKPQIKTYKLQIKMCKLQYIYIYICTSNQNE